MVRNKLQLGTGNEPSSDSKEVKKNILKCINKIFQNNSNVFFSIKFLLWIECYFFPERVGSVISEESNGMLWWVNTQRIQHKSWHRRWAHRVKTVFLLHCKSIWNPFGKTALPGWRVAVASKASVLSCLSPVNLLYDWYQVAASFQSNV